MVNNKNIPTDFPLLIFCILGIYVFLLSFSFLILVIHSFNRHHLTPRHHREYTITMPKIKQAIKKFLRKGFWLTKENVKNIKIEANKNFAGNESALMRHIINQWFK
jgi:hypothetical protein